MTDAEYPARLEDWLYYKLYVGKVVDGLDFLITSTVPGILEGGGFDRWFFLRYIDEGGFHLRLRIRAEAGRKEELAERAQNHCGRGLAQLPSLSPSGYRPMVIPPGEEDQSAFEKFGIGITDERYEPEYPKFGGEKGIAIAEKVFEVSSNVAVAVLRHEQKGLCSRKTLAPWMMNIALDTIRPDTNVDGFLEEYTRYWLGGDTPGAADWWERFTEKRQQLHQEGVPILAPLDSFPDSVVEQLKSWQAALGEAVETYERRKLLTKSLRESLLFNFMHLMNNRLGFSPLEEAYLSVLLTGSHKSVVVA